MAFEHDLVANLPRYESLNDTAHRCDPDNS
jgi:hypothetical protein